jgi:hypothetical protein
MQAAKQRYGGTNVNRHRMRCARSKRGCGRRFTLRQPLSRYRRPVRCPYCRSTQVFDAEKERRADQLRQATCFCAAYPFPHRRGSLRMCSRHPLNGQDVTDEEHEQYQACLATPRSSGIK